MNSYVCLQTTGYSKWLRTLATRKCFQSEMSSEMNFKEAVPKFMGPDLMPALWSPPSWIADYCSRDGVVSPVPKTLFCTDCTDTADDCSRDGADCPVPGTVICNPRWRTPQWGHQIGVNRFTYRFFKLFQHYLHFLSVTRPEPAIHRTDTTAEFGGMTG